MKLRINTKLLLFILSSSIILFLSIQLFVSINSRSILSKNAFGTADLYAQQNAKLSEGHLNYFMNSISTLGKVFENYNSIPDSLRRLVLSQTMQKVLNENKEFLSVWSIMEPNSIDNFDNLHKNKLGSTVLGNFSYFYYKDQSNIVLSQHIEQNPDEVFSGKVYTLLKSSLTETVVDPYFYSYTGNKQNEILQTNMVVPIIVDNQFKGVLGVNVPLNTLQEMTDKIKPFPESFAYLISNNGQFVTHKSNVGKSFSKVYSQDEEDYNILQKTKNGETISFTSTDNNGNKNYTTIVPVKIGITNSPWAIGIVVPISVMMEKANRNLNISILLGLIGISLIAIIILVISKTITRPIINVTLALKSLAEGNISGTNKLNEYASNETGEIEKSVDSLIDNLSKTSDFAMEIGHGNFSAKFDLSNEEDNLGTSLIEMRNNLKKAQKEEAEKQLAEKNESWITHGITMLGEILRKYNNNIEDLTYYTTKFIINYLNANQGALYVINDNDPNNIFYEQETSIGYDTRYMLEPKYEIGEGYIGKCAFEEHTIYMSVVPKDYIKIASGLGEALPTSIIINPLKVNNEIVGIIQIDSFNQIQEHEKEFLERISETIASSIKSVKINVRTTQLLEQSQQQSEELSAQEEEMRQNMEEMQATQEEASSNEVRFNSIINAIKSGIIYAVYNTEGQVVDTNNAFCDLYDLSVENIIGKYIWEISLMTESDKIIMQNNWNQILSNQLKEMYRTIQSKNSKINVLEKYSLIKNEDGMPTKIISLVLNLTES